MIAAPCLDESEAANVLSQRAAWLNGGIGVMVHYLSDVSGRNHLPETTWDEAVAGFPVEQFICQLKEAGAKWLIFTLGQNTGRYNQPNAQLDALVPGACCKRPLALEIAKRCQEEGIRFIAYLPAEVCSNTSAIKAALLWDRDPVDKSLFVQRYTEVIAQWSTDFGAALDGWWFDGCYEAEQKPFLPDSERGWKFSTFDHRAYFRAARHGNPNTIVSFCGGANNLSVLHPEQDFLAGEMNDLLAPPSNVPASINLHALTYLDCFWMHTPGGYKENKLPDNNLIPPPRFHDDTLADFCDSWFSVGAGITFNVGIYRDGAMAEPSLQQVARMCTRNLAH